MSLSPFTQTVHLQGQHAELTPLIASHHDDLVEAVKDGELWRHWYTAIPTPEKMADEIARRMNLHQQGSMLPFSVLVNGKAVGMTTYMNIDAGNMRVEIGSTWYRRSVQRSLVNTECAKLDGILRNHQINHHPDAAGALRDTCVYSILNTEWPSVKAHLDYQLSRSREA
jgi:RimJ/RimL family protein N-acetyltransferase